MSLEGRADTPASSIWSLDGQVALVTGGSSGLGQRFAAVLCHAGAHVLVTGRRSDRLRSLCEELGETTTFVVGDLTSPDHRGEVTDLIEARFGRLDVLVNNAGRCDGGPLEDQTLEELTSVLDVNLTAVLDIVDSPPTCCFDPTEPGSSTSRRCTGLVGSRGAMAAYNASKGAVVNLTRHLAAQWGDRGVRVNALAPGYFPSEMTGGLTDPDFVTSINERTLLGRIPTIDEIDGPLLFLASAASSYVTGHIPTVDGGWTAV